MAGKVPPKKIIETIREATGATDEDIKMVLAECNNDVNEATARLIDNPFATVVSKKDRRKEREEQNKKERAAEAKRQSANSQRGGRGGRGGKGRPNGQPRRPVADGQVPKKSLAAAQPKAAPQVVEKPQVDDAPAVVPQVTRTGGTMADLFKPKPVHAPAKAPAPKQVRQPPAAQAPRANPPTQETKVVQHQAPNAWAKNASEEQARPQAPSAPPTGLATSLMSALGAGKQTAQRSLPTQQTRPSAGQGQISESEERRQPGSTSADGVGLDLQFGNFGLGATNDFGSGFGSTFESQQNQATAPAQASTRYNESASSGQDKPFSSFQQPSETASRPQADSQQQMQGAYGYTGYQQAAAYWQPQQPARHAPQQEQRQDHQAKPKPEPHMQQQQQQQQQQQAQYPGYAAPNMGAMGHQYPGYGQYAGYGNYYQYYQQAPYPYYAPQQAPQYAAPPPAPAAGQAPRAAANNFGAMYEQQEPAYQQPPPSVNYQGQPAYNYGGQYAR